METPTYIHLVNAITPNLNKELNALTRLTTLGTDIGAPQPQIKDKERQLFFTRWFSENEGINTDIDFNDFINSIYIYASYKVYPNSFQILLINFPNDYHQQIEKNYLDNEYKLEPIKGEEWAKIPSEYYDIIEEEELLLYFNEWFEVLGKEIGLNNLYFDEDEVNSERNQKILDFISNHGKRSDILYILSEYIKSLYGDDMMEDMMEDKYQKYKLKYIILKNLKNSI